MVLLAGTLNGLCGHDGGAAVESGNLGRNLLLRKGGDRERHAKQGGCSLTLEPSLSEASSHNRWLLAQPNAM